MGVGVGVAVGVGVGVPVGAGVEVGEGVRVGVRGCEAEQAVISRARQKTKTDADKALIFLFHPSKTTIFP